MTGLFGEADPLPTASLTAGRKGESKFVLSGLYQAVTRCLPAAPVLCSAAKCIVVILLTQLLCPLLPLSGKDGLESGEDGGDDSNNANPFPEAEIDDMRAVRDAALARYIQVR